MSSSDDRQHAIGFCTLLAHSNVAINLVWCYVLFNILDTGAFWVTKECETHRSAPSKKEQVQENMHIYFEIFTLGYDLNNSNNLNKNE